MKLRNAVICLLFAGQFATLYGLASPQHKPVTGEVLFKQYCAECHVGGGNRVRESHPIAGSKTLSSVVTFKDYLKSPPGHMPYYQSVVKNERILNALYKYCKSMPPPPIKSASISE
jgi:mono/diheme cytochrome c family protein